MVGGIAGVEGDGVICFFEVLISACFCLFY